MARHSRVRRAVPLLVFGGVLAAGVGATYLLGAEDVVRLAAAVALFAVALAAAAVAALSMVLRRRLRELRYLPDLGRRFVTQHQHARVTSISHDHGGLTLHITSDGSQTVVLDEHGMPDHATTSVAGTADVRIPNATGLRVDHLALIEALALGETPVVLTTSGTVGLAGPVAQSWRLEADNGLVLSNGL